MAADPPPSDPLPPPVLNYGPPAPAPGPSGMPQRLRGLISAVVVLAVFLYLLLKWLTGWS
jgi:hypothetical protein